MFFLLIVLLIHNTDLDMNILASQLRSVKKLALLLDDYNLINYEKREEYNNRYQSLFRDNCNQYVETLEFEFPCRCMRVGRRSAMLSWFENLCCSHSGPGLHQNTVPMYYRYQHLCL